MTKKTMKKKTTWPRLIDQSICPLLSNLIFGEYLSAEQMKSFGKEKNYNNKCFNRKKKHFKSTWSIHHYIFYYYYYYIINLSIQTNLLFIANLFSKKIFKHWKEKKSLLTTMEKIIRCNDYLWITTTTKKQKNNFLIEKKLNR